MPGFGADQGVTSEPVEDPEAGEAKQASLGDVEAREAELGELGGGEDLVLGEDRDAEPVALGERADHAEQVGRA